MWKPWMVAFYLACLFFATCIAGNELPSTDGEVQQESTLEAFVTSGHLQEWPHLIDSQGGEGKFKARTDFTGGLSNDQQLRRNEPFEVHPKLQQGYTPTADLDHTDMQLLQDRPMSHATVQRWGATAHRVLNYDGPAADSYQENHLYKRLSQGKFTARVYRRLLQDYTPTANTDPAGSPSTL